MAGGGCGSAHPKIHIPLQIAPSLEPGKSFRLPEGHDLDSLIVQEVADKTDLAGAYEGPFEKTTMRLQQ